MAIAYLARRSDGAFLLETRPPSGLLGGMLGWPGSDWVAADPTPAPPVTAEWHDPGLEVRHTFTHFHLRLRPAGWAVVRSRRRARRGGGLHRQSMHSGPTRCQTVMRKAHDLARDQWAGLLAPE